MIDPSEIDLRRKGTRLGEFATNHTELILQDFRNKATNVLRELEEDFVIKFPGSNLDVSLPAKDTEMIVFDTKISQMVIRRLRRVVEGGELENRVATAKEVMSVFRMIVLRFPTRIPKYFKEYKINEDLNKFTGDSVDGGRVNYYWPDAFIEMYQDETEAVIIFALELARNGVSIPKKYSDLKILYEESKKRLIKLE